MTVSPSSATYVSGTNVVLTVTGGTVTSIKEESTTVASTNYTVSGSTVTIKSSYLSGFTAGTHRLTLYAGIDDGYVDITISASEAKNGKDD